MDETAVAEICRRNGCGTPLGAPERVLGGLKHQLYHLRAAHGEFAVKVLSPASALSPAARARFHATEQIAALVASAGLPAVSALSTGGDVLQDIGSSTMLVYPWVAGAISSADPPCVEQAARMGELLARIHLLGLDPGALRPGRARAFRADAWTTALAEAEKRQLHWAAEFRASLGDLARWGRLAARGRRALDTSWVVSHGDLHRENVLWTDPSSPWMLDWESAGLHQQPKDVVVCALEWSGFVEGEPDLPAFAGFVAAYQRRVALSAAEALCGYHACFGNWLGWLHFNVQRALGIAAPDPEEQAMGAEQVTGTLATIRRAENSFPALLEVVRETCRT